MAGIVAVMDVMMRGALGDVAEPGADRQPEMAVAQVEDSREIDEEDDVDFEKPQWLRFTEDIGEDSIAQPERTRGEIGLQQILERMRARRRRGRQHFGGMMRLVEFPQQR